MSLAASAAIIGAAAVPPVHAQEPQSQEQTIRITQDQAGVIVGAMWQQALAHLRDGAPRAAIPILERLVSIAPGVTRFRLELARAYFLVRDDDKAAFHFQRALGDPITSAEEVAVRQFLDQIEARKNWDVQLTFNLLTESNPGKRTETEIIDIGGLPFELDDTAEAGVGYDATARVTFYPRITRDVSGRLQFSARDRGFNDSSLDERSLGTEIGLVQRQDGGTSIGLGISAEKRWVETDPFSATRGVFLDVSTVPERSTRLSFRIEYEDIEHEDLTNRDGHSVGLTLNVQRAISSQFAVRGSLNAKRTDAQAGFESGDVLGVVLGTSYSFEGGWTGILDVGLSRDVRDSASGLFTVARDDRTSFISARTLYRDFAFEGFTPVIGLRYEVRESTLDLYDYSNLGVTFGITRLF